MEKDNMNVWIAMWYSGSYFAFADYHVLGVYSTKEKAEERVAEFKDSGFFFVDSDGTGDDCYIYEQKVDEKILTIGEAYKEKYGNE